MDYTPETLREAARDTSGQTTNNYVYHALWKRRGERMSRLLTELCQTRHERDMLARRCAEQAAEIARLLAPADTPKATIHEAIAKMQAGGLR